MRNDTRIFILKLRQIIMAALIIIAALILMIFLLIRPKNIKESVESTPTSTYVAGVYTSSITLGEENVDIQVIVDNDRIKSARIVHLDDSVAAMYPLLQTSMNDISEQIANGISPDQITTSQSNHYTTQVLLSAIKKALEKAH